MKFPIPILALSAAVFAVAACDKSPVEKAADDHADVLESKAKEVKANADQTEKAIKEHADATIEAVKKEAKADVKATEQAADAAAKTLEKRADEVRDAAKDSEKDAAATPVPALDTAPTKPMETPVP